MRNVEKDEVMALLDRACDCVQSVDRAFREGGNINEMRAQLADAHRFILTARLIISESH